jgi:glycosyltransferase involved in cell wall biosynthesis
MQPERFGVGWLGDLGRGQLGLTALPTPPPSRPGFSNQRELPQQARDPGMRPAPVMADRRHVALVTNTGWSMVRYRGELIAGLLARGWRVSAIADFDERQLIELRRQGVAPIRLEVEGSGQNPLQDLRYLLRLARLLRALRPDLVHNFSIKPVIYGSLAAKLVGLKCVVNSITGSGVLEAGDQGRLQRVIRPLYRIALAGRPVAIFQNRDDLERFVGRGLIGRARAVHIAGSGVDTAALTPDLSVPPGERTGFVMASRMLWSKGVADFVAAARLVKQRHPQASFVLFGGSAEDYGSKNPDFIPRAWLEQLEEDGAVAWRGLCDPAVVAAAMRRAAAVVLPSSYAEGVPRALIEAAAAGAPIITSDTPGCRDTVIDRRSGFLCPLHDPEHLAAAMSELLAHPHLIIAMGRAGRELAVARFDRDQVIEATLAVYAQQLERAATSVA